MSRLRFTLPSPPAKTFTSHVATRPVLLSLLGGALLTAAPLTQAVDFGPFSLTGFAKVESVVGNNHCEHCQLHPNEDKQRVWADELVPGSRYETTINNVSLFQPWLGVKFDLGRGFKLSGLLSQRWRDGKEDIPGFLYEKNLALSHEDYGSLRFGDMTTRTWSMADHPYGTNFNVSDVWASSGAGYGLLRNALRYTAPPIDVFNGDLVLEATYSAGNTDFDIHEPRFWEFYAQYHRGDLVIDAMVQDSRNGNPQAWSHGPFWGPTYHEADDGEIGSSRQSIAMILARYQVNPEIEVSGGLRRNHWSGAYAVITQSAVYDHLGQLVSPELWNSMFNVDWGGSLNGVANPGYSATSYDAMLGIRYRHGPWTPSVGLVHLGTASTDNPSERGQSNAATVLTAGLSYDFGNGFRCYGFGGTVHYKRLGLSPMSMPGNSAFTNVDSRVTRDGVWLGLGVEYVF